LLEKYPFGLGFWPADGGTLRAAAGALSKIGANFEGRKCYTDLENRAVFLVGICRVID